jgi:hypothetical protein
MNGYEYFADKNLVIKKKYDALKDFFFYKEKAEIVAQKYNYTLSAFYSLVRDFKIHLKNNSETDFFFQNKKIGRQHLENKEIDEIILSLRKKNFSTEDILTFLHAKSFNVSYGYVYNLLISNGFAKLPKRSVQEKANQEIPKLTAEKAVKLQFDNEEFMSQNVSLFCFRLLIEKYGITKIIQNSDYPQTKSIDRLSSILSFLALKLSNVRRYSAVDIWCMDRGIGLFAGLNVLPKNGWFSSYSHRVTKDMNTSFLKNLHKIWVENNLLSDTVNLDFTTIPYWGDNAHLENNWSGKRTKALASMLAVLAQDPDSGIIDYGDADVRHENQSQIVLEFIDFYSNDQSIHHNLKYLVFDSKFTTYENLSKINEKQIKFITIRMRSQSLVNKINNIDAKSWKKIRVECGDNKNRDLLAFEETVNLSKYEDVVRQIDIKGNGKIKPAVIITNDFDLSLENVVRKYARRWIVEKVISEQIEFFHLNRVSSSMVIKVDFDLTMSILAHNLYRLFALQMSRYSNCTSVKIYEKFIQNNGFIKIEEEKILIKMKKKRDLPQLLETMKNFEEIKIPQFDDKKLVFEGLSSS